VAIATVVSRFHPVCRHLRPRRLPLPRRRRRSLCLRSRIEKKAPQTPPPCRSHRRAWWCPWGILWRRMFPLRCQHPRRRLCRLRRRKGSRSLSHHKPDSRSRRRNLHLQRTCQRPPNHSGRCSDAKARRKRASAACPTFCSVRPHRRPRRKKLNNPRRRCLVLALAAGALTAAAAAAVRVAMLTKAPKAMKQKNSSSSPSLSLFRIRRLSSKSRCHFKRAATNMEAAVSFWMNQRRKNGRQALLPQRHLPHVPRPPCRCRRKGCSSLKRRRRRPLRRKAGRLLGILRRWLQTANYRKFVQEIRFSDITAVYLGKQIKGGLFVVL